ncbi:MAG TPA: PAS domain-containing sensor histidine kinase, partial [Anaeromyxobacteraceae bacterium]|nr:PAS domain-containing sensor histidine kinase [Anaeromyxobacteraceae bacterium]
MQRTYREIVRDAARLSGAPLVQLVVCGEYRGQRRCSTAAVEGALVGARPVRDAVEKLLVTNPGLSPDDPLLAQRATTIRALARCEAPLARLLPPPTDRLGWRTAAFRLMAPRDVVVLRFVLQGPLKAPVMKALEAVVRLSAARLEAEDWRKVAVGQSAAYRAFMEHAGEAIFVVDPGTGRILDGNSTLLALTGRRDRDLRRLTIDRIVDHPEHSGERLLPWLRSAAVVRTSEAQLLRWRGEPLPVALTAARIELPDRPVIHVIAHDTTPERRALAEVRGAKDTLSALTLSGTRLMELQDEEEIVAALARDLSQLGLHVAILGEDPEEPVAAGGGRRFRWRFHSFPAEMMSSVEKELGFSLASLRIDPEEAPLVKRCMDEGIAIATEKVRAAVHDLLGGTTPEQARAVGRLFGYRRVVLAPLRSAGRTTGLLAVAAPPGRRGDPQAVGAFALQTSIALEKARLLGALRQERAHLEYEVDRRTRELQAAVRALEETDRKKDNFLANISHELRTPLVTVLGYADLLLGERLGPIQPRQRAALSVVLSSGKRLRGFIDELLDFSRHELTREALLREPFDLVEALHQAVTAFAPRFAERRIRIRIRTARPHPLPRALGDRGRVLQI